MLLLQTFSSGHSCTEPDSRPARVDINKHTSIGYRVHNYYRLGVHKLFDSQVHVGKSLVITLQIIQCFSSVLNRCYSVL